MRLLRPGSPRRLPPATGGTYGGDERYRAYDAPVTRRRNFWPWLIVAGALIALGIGGWFLYGNVQDQINDNKPLVVQQYTGILEVRAVDLIRGDGFEPNVRRVPNGDQPVGIVFDQSPVEGTSLQRDGIVTILVSTGKKSVTVPDVVGSQVTDAVATLTRAGLVAKSVGVASDKLAGTVTAQDPSSGTSVTEGATVRINYSTGPKQVAVPPVVGLDYSAALQQLQASGFAVARVDVESPQAAGIVVSQVPTGSSTATKGSKVTLSVSNGPQTTPVPDVTGLTTADARTTLTDAGFKVTVTKQETDVETFDGVVISQDPPGNTQQDPNTVITLFVGTYIPPETTPADTTTTDDADADAMSPRIRVAVLAGGRSSEHEISLASARSVVDALDPDRYETRTIEIGRDGAWALPPGAAAVGAPGRQGGLARADGVRPTGSRSRRRGDAHSPRARSARTGRCRACSSSPTSHTSAQASPPPRCAWTRTCSRRCSAIAGSRSRRASRSAPETPSRTRSATPCS